MYAQYASFQTYDIYFRYAVQLPCHKRGPKFKIRLRVILEQISHFFMKNRLNQSVKFEYKN